MFRITLVEVLRHRGELLVAILYVVQILLEFGKFELLGEYLSVFTFFIVSDESISSCFGLNQLLWLRR